MSYRGVYDRTVFTNPVSHFTIISVKTNDSNVPEHVRSTYKFRDHLIRFTATGFALPQSDAIELVLDGEWVKDEKFGYQLQVEHCTEVVPRTIEGVRGYLASGLLKGIGQATATDIVNRFGVGAMEILEQSPERLLEVKGITEERLEVIKESYAETHAVRDLMAFLAPFDVTAKIAIRIQQSLGANSVSILRRHPFELCRFPGFGFSRVDAIAQKNGLRPNAPMRIESALSVTLNRVCEEKGHLYLQKDELCRETLKLLNKKLPAKAPRVVIDEVRVQLDTLILRGEVVSYKDFIYSRRYFALEDETARRVAEILINNEVEADIQQTMEDITQQFNITLSDMQRSAVEMALHHRLSIITGSPGTGKTTVLKTVLEVYRKLHPDDKLLLAAPTGRASRNMAESTGFENAQTMHNAMGLLSGEEDNEYVNNTDDIDAGLIIIDEFSMADMWLAAQLFSRLKPGANLLLVGDADQLPSVGPGKVFRELIACGLVPVTVLDKIFRQAEGSLIALNAMAIKEGRDEDIVFDDEQFIFIERETQQEVAAEIQKTYLNEVKHLSMSKMQILSPFLSKGEASMAGLNRSIREMVNPGTPEIPDLHVGAKIFRDGDRVMQNKNKDGIFNGDVGFICAIDSEGEDGTAVTIDFSYERVKVYDVVKMRMVELAYAVTIHKAMGSEYTLVILPMLADHMILLDRSMVYTAITRAKQRVYLVGEKDIFFLALKRDKASRRNTLLGQRIALYFRSLRLQQLLVEERRIPEQLKLTG